MKVIRQPRVRAVFRMMELPNGKTIRIRVLALEERMRIAAQAIVESAHFAGYRTVKNLIKIAKENYSKVFEKITLTDRQRAAIIGHRHREQRKALDPRVQELLLLEPDVLFWISRNIGRIRIAQRYRNESQLDRMLPPAALDDERAIQIKRKGKRFQKFLDKWEEESKKQKKERQKKERKLGIKQEKPKKKRRNRMKGTYADYVKSLVSKMSDHDIRLT